MPPSGGIKKTLICPVESEMNDEMRRKKMCHQCNLTDSIIKVPQQLVAIPFAVLSSCM